MRPLALVRNSTWPSTSANRVWSLPRPTFGPGCHLVPRWRAMILPATAYSPPNSFKPSRWLFESRPLREEPPAFLCAMASNPSVGRYLAQFCDEIITFFGDFSGGLGIFPGRLSLYGQYGRGAERRNP